MHSGYSSGMRKIASAAALAIAIATLFAGVSLAQTPLDIDTVLDNIATAAGDLEDVSFLLTGSIIDPDGTTIALEVDFEIIPTEVVARAYILQPDALADNEIILDGSSVYNYTFLTHQVMIFDSNDPDALGGFLPAGEDGASATLSFDLNAIFAGFEASIVEVVETEYGPTYRISFSNKDSAALILDVEALVPASDWLPRRLVFMETGGRVLAILNAENMRIDRGLDVRLLRELPFDAEVIDNRN